MEIITMQSENKPLTVTVEYPVLDSRAREIIEKIRTLGVTIPASRDGQTYPLAVSDIYYIEVVERRTFLYTKDAVYAADRKLYELEKLLKSSGILRISKFCLMNLHHLYSIRQLRNSQLEATLDNEEKLIVARTYLKSIKTMLKEERP